jgi:hypothetical protein
MKFVFPLVFIMLMTPVSGSTAQSRDSVSPVVDTDPPYRNPERARKLAMVVPGAGYVYTGEYFRGYLTWVGTAVPILGGVISFDQPCGYALFVPLIDPFKCTTTSRWPSRATGALLVAGGLWTFISSVRDARHSAERTNARHLRRVVPVLTGPTGLNPAWQAGVSVGW